MKKAFATQLQFTNFRYDDISPIFGEGKLGLLQPKMRKGHHNHFSIEMMTLIYQEKKLLLLLFPIILLELYFMALLGRNLNSRVGTRG